MRLIQLALVGIAGIVSGLVLGYALWGLQVDELSWNLGKTTNELVKTQGWLNDEIRSSDERQEELASHLSTALSDLAKARAQLARVTAARRPPTGSGAPEPAAAVRSVELPPPPPPWANDLR